jgi:hypothetical protein
MVPEEASSGIVRRVGVLVIVVRLCQRRRRVLGGVLPTALIYFARKAFCVLHEQYIEVTRVSSAIQW